MLRPAGSTLTHPALGALMLLLPALLVVRLVVVEVAWQSLQRCLWLAPLWHPQTGGTPRVAHRPRVPPTARVALASHLPNHENVRLQLERSYLMK